MKTRPKENEGSRDEYISCIGNLTLIDPSINCEIGDTPPEDHFKTYNGAELLEKHMIPENPKLWEVENCEKFLEARWKLIWNKVSEMLGELEC